DTGSGLPCPYFSMKLVEGGSLAQHLAQFTGRSRDSARLILTVARAVEYAHQRGILHRDLKPGNILLDGDAETPVTRWTPLVADFGLAKRLAGAGQSTEPPTPAAPATQPGGAVGTPSYMAPEQATGSAQVTTAVDVYSLGAILYECLAGRPPFRTSTGLGTLLAALEQEAEPPSRHCSGIDRDLDTICLKCLQKEPGRRYATAGALADDLQRYLDGEPIHARPVGRIERLARWCRRQPLLAALSAAVVLSVTVGVALVVWQWQRAESHLRETLEERAETERQRDRAEKIAEAEARQKNEAKRQRDRAEEQQRLAEKNAREA